MPFMQPSRGTGRNVVIFEGYWFLNEFVIDDNFQVDEYEQDLCISGLQAQRSSSWSRLDVIFQNYSLMENNMNDPLFSIIKGNRYCL
jgi:hypothetical protein